MIIRDPARSDIDEAVDWYEERVPGLGGEFLRSLDGSLAAISRNPAMYPVVYRKAQMTVVRRFPYLIIFREFDDFISVVAVMHGRRNPRRWQELVTE